MLTDTDNRKHFLTHLKGAVCKVQCSRKIAYFLQRGSVKVITM